MWLNILLGMITFITLIILILYRRQVGSIWRQLRFIEKNDTNKIISTEINFKEITELADELNNIIKNNHQLAVSYKRKDNLLKETITNISHDIRTPLTSLKGYFELLVDSKDENERIRYSRVIESRISSLHEMLEQLFTYVKLQNEAYELCLEKCDLNKILYESIFSFYDDFKNKKLEPTVSIPDQNYYIWANEEGMKRSIQNIIKNALDHGRDQIIIEMNCDNSRAKIIVKNKFYCDSGLDIDKIFDRFYMADASRNNQSTGLGLSIAYELINRMNGKIAASIEADYFVIKIEFTL